MLFEIGRGGRFVYIRRRVSLVMFRDKKKKKKKGSEKKCTSKTKALGYHCHRNPRSHGSEGLGDSVHPSFEIL